VILTHHPLRYSLPGIGLPKHARSTKEHTMYEVKGRGGARTIVLEEVNRVTGVPFSDRFEIHCVWRATWEAVGGPARVTLELQVHYIRPFLLERTVERSSVTETREALELWLLLVDGRLQDAGRKGIIPRQPQPPPTTTETPTTVKRRKRFPLMTYGRSRASCWARKGFVADMGPCWTVWTNSNIRSTSVLLLTGIVTSLLFYKTRSKFDAPPR
jgi:hypothetical protein